MNVKLMKCGGLRRARRLIETARAHQLSVFLPLVGASTSPGSPTTRLRDGKLLERWEYFDRLGLLQQLGAIQI